MKKLLVFVLISAWTALGIAAVLPHSHAGEKGQAHQATHLSCVICQAQSIQPVQSTTPVVSAPALVSFSVVFEKIDSPAVPVTAFCFSSRAPPVTLF